MKTHKLTPQQMKAITKFTREANNSHDGGCCEMLVVASPQDDDLPEDFVAGWEEMRPLAQRLTKLFTAYEEKWVSKLREAAQEQDAA